MELGVSIPTQHQAPLAIQNPRPSRVQSRPVPEKATLGQEWPNGNLNVVATHRSAVPGGSARPRAGTAWRRPPRGGGGRGRGRRRRCVQRGRCGRGGGWRTAAAPRGPGGGLCAKESVLFGKAKKGRGKHEFLPLIPISHFEKFWCGFGSCSPPFEKHQRNGATHPSRIINCKL